MITDNKELKIAQFYTFCLFLSLIGTRSPQGSSSQIDCTTQSKPKNNKAFETAKENFPFEEYAFHM